VTATGNNATDPDWGPEGTRLVYVRPFLPQGAADTTSGLFLLDLLTGQDRPLTHSGLATFGGVPRWSPDGSAIAFSYGSPLHVFIIKPDGTGYRDLTPNASTDNTDPSWNATGNALTYEAFNRTDRQKHETRIVGRDGSGDGRFSIQLRPMGVRSALSRDGLLVAYDSLNAGRDTLVLYLKAATTALHVAQRRLASKRFVELRQAGELR